MRAVIAFVVVIAVLAAGGFLIARYFKPVETSIPTVAVRQGDFLVKTYTRGDLRVVTSSMIIAPNVGQNLVITELAAMGQAVKKGDRVLAFDPAEQQNHLLAHKSSVSEADETIAKSTADTSVREHTDKVELLKAEFAVRRAELDVSRNELVSEIDAQKNLLTLEAARKRLAQLREDARSRAKSSEAEMAVAREKLNKANLDLKQAQQRISKLTVPAPIDGLASISQNRRAAGGFFYPGIDLPDYREGDQVNSGDTVMEVIDTSQMEVAGRIIESDRGNLREGQDVLVRLDAMPGRTLGGTVKSLAGMTSRGWFLPDPSKRFDVVFSLTEQAEGLRPGMTAEVEIITERIPDAIHVPLQAVFEKEGKKFVYVRRDGTFERREITTGRQSESQVMVTKGLEGSEHIALLDPEARKETGRRARNPLSGPMGGGR